MKIERVMHTEQPTDSEGNPTSPIPVEILGLTLTVPKIKSYWPTKKQFAPDFLDLVSQEIADNPPPTTGYEKATRGDVVSDGSGGWKYEYSVADMNNDPSSIDTRRRKRKEELKNKRQQVVDGGTTITGDEVRTDAKGRASLVESLSVEDLVPGQSFDWNTQDGGWVTLSYGQLKQYQTGVNGHVQDSFTNHRSLDAELDAATTLEEIDAVDIESGWPGDEDEDEQ
jgi:hypothetical protein